MESRPHCLSFLYAVLCILASILFTHSDARLMIHIWKKHQGSNLHEKLITTNSIGFDGDPYTLDSPFYLPHSDSLSPLLPQPDHSPPFTPQSPSNPLPPPASYGLPTPPPPSNIIHSPPTPPPPSNIIHSPPANPPEAGSPEHGFNPPSIFSSPPQHQPNPPKNASTPPKQVPGQPISEPPVLNPPPRSTPHKGSRSGTWCVAKPTVPDSLIQAAMDYACGSGGDCKSIQPNQACFQPNTMISHASYAFNSYWQNKKGTGGTCDFGGTAMLVTVDPSFGKCQFRNN
ncbi:formin-like protein 7 [Gossypium australe]|uniref:Formin-like protein 7 n=1 Tax=Gossypium australe TaxID=47621 RepID=A0A5B6UYP7_9ROSI|nr:formin-like protein 7 [Gossypium australe]